MLLNKKENIYFNSMALWHIFFLVLLYIGVDVFFIDYRMDVNAYSKGFYYKLTLCILYLIGSKEKQLSFQSDKGVIAAFHFSVLYLCLWMGVISFVLEDITKSRYVGVFLVFGGLSGFNLVDEALKLLRVKMQSYIVSLYIAEIMLKLFLFSIFCLAAFFFISGDWVWNLKPFYEWF